MCKSHLKYFALLLLIFTFCDIGAATAFKSGQLKPRVLQQTATYALVKEFKDDQNNYHYQAKYQGAEKDWKGSEIVQNLHMIVNFHERDVLNLKIISDDSKRWEIPNRFPFPHFPDNVKLLTNDNSNYKVEVTKEPFSFVVSRKDTGEVLFDTTNKNFVYSDVYIELSTSLPTDTVYGFGERNYKFKLNPGVYSIWPRDDPKVIEYGQPGGNAYGHHPVGLIRDKTGNFFLTFMRNSNAMDIVIEGAPSLTYKMIGGVIDLVFFTGDKYPETVLKAYHNYIGNFTMMPFWSMGYHQSKWGYVDHATMLDVVTNYINHEIPLDVIWSDIDYMIEKEIFTVNTWEFPLDKMRELTTVYGKKWVPIIDPGVKKNNARGPGLAEGLKRDIFIKNSKGGNLIGSVWPGDTYFPDFFHPDCSKYWGEMLDVLYNQIPFAGIWLDMNEIANFVDGDIEHHRAGRYENLPYNVGAFPLKRKTISLDAVHWGNIIEYDVHTQYNLLETQATHQFLETKSKLPFILTRATSVGIGRFTTHWTGDNGASWDFLKFSIPGNFNFQIFGIPFVGADICGFMDGTNEELCARWVQLGALYPFARNHHEERTRSQEPWTFTLLNRGVSIVDTTRIALKTRYATLKWYYSLFIATRGAGSVFKPVMFEFPDDDKLYQDGIVDYQFMLGSSVLCTPKVEPGEPSLTAYFPKAIWYELFTGKQVIGETETERSLNVKAPFDAPVPHFLRGGHIVHQQNVDGVLSTQDLEDDFELIIGFDKGQNGEKPQARGSIMGIQEFDDDSVYYRCMEDNCLYDIVATINEQDSSSATIEITVNRQSEDVKTPLDDLALFGLKLYGMDLKFLDEDERKIGYAILQVKKADGEVSVNPSLKRLLPMAEGAFSLEFNEHIRIQDEDIIVIELIV